MLSSIPLPDLPTVNSLLKNTLAEALDMRITVCKAGHVEATMPVDHRTRQPLGLLHGGASVALAETVASLGGGLLVAAEGKTAVGLEINANHLRPVKEGRVRAVGTLLHRGKTTQVWEIRLYDDQNRLTAISRCTLAIIDPR